MLLAPAGRRKEEGSELLGSGDSGATVAASIWNDASVFHVPFPYRRSSSSSRSQGGGNSFRSRRPFIVPGPFCPRWMLMNPRTASSEAVRGVSGVGPSTAKTLEGRRRGRSVGPIGISKSEGFRKGPFSSSLSSSSGSSWARRWGGHRRQRRGRGRRRRTDQNEGGRGRRVAGSEMKGKRRQRGPVVARAANPREGVFDGGSRRVDPVRGVASREAPTAVTFGSTMRANIGKRRGVGEEESQVCPI